MSKTYEQVLNGNYESHVLPFLWQKGESKDIIEEYLHKMKESDIHEVCLESRPHPDFCGEAWWTDLAFIIEVCKKLDMKIWLLDDSHFPTGYANGAIKETYPEHRKTVLTHRNFDIIGPQTKASIYLKHPFDPTEVFYGAVLIDHGKVSELNYEKKGDQIFFDVDEGHYQICVIFTSRKSGYQDDYINMVDKASCDVLIKAVYEPHYEHFKEEFGKTILGFFSDEPGFMNEKGVNADSLIGKESMMLPWSEELEQRWKEVYQDQYLIHLPALWMEVDHFASIRHSYMDIATTLYKECFDENLGTWCRERGVMHIGHVIEDKDSHARLGVGAGHYFRALAGQDMAGVDIVINQLVPGIDEGCHSYGRGKWDMEFFNYALPKLGSSLAHIDPIKKGRCMAEVFGAFGWHEGLKEMKWISDHFLVRGINYFVPHAFSQAEFPDVDCPPHFYAHGHNPQFRYFSSLMSYLNRMGTLFSGGTPHPTAAVLYHADGEWCGNFMPIQKVAKELTRNQIDFDFVPADVFTDPTRYQTVINEQGLTINGIHYSCFILPYNEYIGKDVENFFCQANQYQFPLYCVDALPAHLYDSEEELCDLSFMRVAALENLVENLQEQHLYDIKTQSYEPWLRYYHYTKDKETYHMFVNEHPKLMIDTFIPGLCGKQVDVYHQESKVFEEHLILHPYESCIIIENETCEYREKKKDTLMTLDGEWKISYASSKQYPQFSQEQIIQKLQDVSSTIYPSMCGTFRYEKDFTLTEDVQDAILLIKEAYETVQVFLDDKDLGYKVAPQYRFAMGSIGAGTHHLCIEVTNTLDKEVHDMFALSEPSEPSGLLGPVEIKA